MATQYPQKTCQIYLYIRLAKMLFHKIVSSSTKRLNYSQTTCYNLIVIKYNEVYEQSEVNYFWSVKDYDEYYTNFVRLIPLTVMNFLPWIPLYNINSSKTSFPIGLNGHYINQHLITYAITKINHFSDDKRDTVIGLLARQLFNSLWQ